MASKRDLVEAQTYSRRRLLTAFISGAPGGQEAEPTKPLRGVVAGVLLTTLIVVGSLAWGQLKPSLPQGWDDGRLVVVKQVGTRYVSSKGVLYPVLNVTSARLAIPSSAFGTVQVSEGQIGDTARGGTIGIVGAPDAPPARAGLVSTGWLSCLVADGAQTLIGVDVPVDTDGDGAADPAGTPVPADSATAVLVRTAGDLYLVQDGVRHRVAVQDVAAVERALDVEGISPHDAPAEWLNLFPEGTDIGPITLKHAGDPVPSASALPPATLVGTVVEVSAAGAPDQHYVVDANGELAPLSTFATPLYALGSGGAVGVTAQFTSADVAKVETSTPVAPADWPTRLPELVDPQDPPCARLTTGETGRVDLVTTEADPQAQAGVVVAPGGGALVAAQTAAGATTKAQLVDESGRAFPIPDPSEELLARLGYQSVDVVPVPPAWTALLPSGPSLTIEAASVPTTRT
ncbi:type VII secretion protein EccB [Cellulomonas sp. URHD0024]|uniref:type VII secretion protein EccB n=1 Tax=Cellulomonas sp. URHD0024 TaxID=1302620 RepID=UPI00041ED48B|nr:type VII secretion protein EccB [Cellulomonas sp. URHD0024]